MNERFDEDDIQVMVDEAIDILGLGPDFCRSCTCGNMSGPPERCWPPEWCDRCMAKVTEVENELRAKWLGVVAA